MADESTIDEPAKRRVRDALVAHLRSRLTGSTEEDDAERAAARLDQDTTLEADDTSHSDESADLEGLLSDRSEEQQRLVRQAEALDVTPTDRVAPGAVVGFGGARYLVGVASDAFDCDGTTYEGIATDAPAFAALEGRRVGDTVTIGDHEHRVDLVG